MNNQNNDTSEIDVNEVAVETPADDSEEFVITVKKLVMPAKPRGVLAE